MAISVVGTVGVPACYGGFESLVEKIQDSGGDIIRFAGDCRMLYDFLSFFSIILF